MKNSMWCMLLVVIAGIALAATPNLTEMTMGLLFLAAVFFAGCSYICGSIENIFKKQLNFTISGSNKNENDTNQ